MLASDGPMLTGWHIAAFVVFVLTIAFVIVSSAVLLGFWAYELVRRQRRRSDPTSHG